MDRAIEALNGLGLWLFEHLWQLSIELALLAAIIALAIRVLRIKSPTIRHLFWCLVLIKPVAVFLVASPVTLYWFVRPALQPVVLRSAETMGSVAPAPPQAMDRPVGTPRVSNLATGKPQHASLNLYGLAASAWLLGVTALATRLAGGYAYLLVLRRRSVPHNDGPLAEALETAARTLRIARRVHMAVTDRCPGPLLTGVLRPVILFPDQLIDRLSRHQLSRIVTHELAHLRRWDNLTLLVQRLVEVVLFFHPVIWLCGWAIRREAEAACDDMVIGAYADRAQYADSLTRVAELRGPIARRLLVSAFVPAESDFVRRVRRVLSSGTPRFTARLAVLAFIALAAVAAVGLPAAAERSGPVVANAEQPIAAAQPESLEVAKEPYVIPSTPLLKKEDHGVVLEGYEKLAIGTRDQTNTITIGLVAALRAAGEDVTYEQLMGIGGAAFRLQLMQPQWCPSSACTGPGFNCQTAIDEAFAHRVVWHDIEHGPPASKPQRIIKARAVTLRSIDAGLPVLWSSEECGLAVGYRYGGQRIVLRQVYKPEDAPGYDLAKGWPWGIGAVEAAGSAKDRRTIALESLQRALDLANAKEFGAYAAGFNAWTLWITQLRDPARFAAMDADTLRRAQHANGYIYYCLIDARSSAAKYLRSIAADLGPSAQPHLLKAADAYDQLVKALTASSPVEIAPMPWMMKEGQQWTQDMRNRQADVLSQARDLEQQALDHIKAALKDSSV